MTRQIQSVSTIVLFETYTYMYDPSLYYQGKYRIPSTRLQGYDYSSSGLYFITVCTKDRLHRFGHIQNNYMCLSPEGSICYHAIQKTQNIRNNVNIDEFVVMPNHIHMIVRLHKNIHTDNVEIKQINVSNNKEGLAVSKRGNIFGPQSHNIPAIIRGFKGSVTSKIKQINTKFKRQPRYHDHIIRNQQEQYRIQNYIINNISRWNADCFNQS